MMVTSAFSCVSIRVGLKCALLTITMRSDFGECPDFTKQRVHLALFGARQANLFDRERLVGEKVRGSEYNAEYPFANFLLIFS